MDKQLTEKDQRRFLFKLVAYITTPATHTHTRTHTRVNSNLHRIVRTPFAYAFPVWMLQISPSSLNRNVDLTEIGM